MISRKTLIRSWSDERPFSKGSDSTSWPSAFGRFLPFMTGSCRPAGCALKRPGNWGLSVREQVFTLRDRLKVIHIAVESFEDLSDFVWVSSTKNYAEGHVHVGSRPNPLRNQVETRTLHNQINCFLKGNDLFPEAIYDGYF